MNLQIVNSLDENIWRDYVALNPQGNIFHTPEIYQVFSHTKGHHPLLQAVVNKHKEILALLTPVQITLADGLFRPLTTRAIVYGSVLCSSTGYDANALDLLLSSYVRAAKRQALFTELRNLADLSLLQGVFAQNGFIYTEHLDYLIDLDITPEQVLQNIGPRTRKHIRQGIRKGSMRIDLLTQHSQLEDWFRLVSKTYREARIPLADRSLFEAAYNILMPKGMVQFWLGRVDSNLVAASAEVLYKDVIYGWYSGVDRAYADESPGELLMWHVLNWGCTHGYKIYDFGGAGKPGEAYGVRDFKAKFGGKLVEHGRNILIHSKALLRVSEKGYQLYRYLIG